MNYIIREIQAKDYIRVAHLYKQLRHVGEQYMFNFYADARKTLNMKSDEKVAELVIKTKAKLENTRFLVLEINGFIEGFIYLSLFKPSETLVYEGLDYLGGEIEHLFIDEKYRGFGLASKLTNEAYKYFKEKGVSVLEIGVNQDNPVFEIYKKWGFESKYCCVNKIF